MRTVKLALPITLALLLAACVPSLHPLYTAKDLVFDPSLLGTWADEDGDQWTFTRSAERGKDKHYRLVVKPKKDVPGQFEATLVQLGAHRFLDLYPEEPEDMNGLYKFHLVAVHSIHRIRLSGDSLAISTLQGDWLKKMLDQNELQIAHEVVGDDGILLTARPAQLQAMVTKYVDDPKAFPRASTYRRTK